MSITSNNLQVREVIHQVVNDPEYKAVSSVPLLSMHQLGLILLTYIGVFGSIALYLFAGVSLWILYPVMIFSFYTAFTPLHDATHRAVSSNKFLNDLLGTISTTPLLPFATTEIYRYLHLSHHRYVGDKDWDPDDNLVVVPTKYFPFGYLILFFPDVLWLYWMVFKTGNRTPIRTKNKTLFMFLGLAVFNIAWFASPYWLEYLLIFFIPNRLGIFCVAYSFAHIQHPEGLKWNDFPFQSTYTLKGNKFALRSLYGQAHHAMHHFLPHIPWYKYHKAWDLANGVFRRQHIPERGVFAAPDPTYKNKVLENAKADAVTHLKVKVASVKDAARAIKTFVFESAVPGEALPEFTAGSHIHITLPSGLIRPYSLVNPPYERDKYQIAVKLDENGRGGSKEMHEAISAGDVLEISVPKNNFLLYENAKKHILISGGIGMTPMLSMAHRLTETDSYFELHLCAKAKEQIPFQYELKNWTFAPNVEIHLDKNGKSSINLSKVLSSPNRDTLIYLCGPLGFNKWIKSTAMDIGWTEKQIKEEIFSMDTAGLSEPKEFELVLGKSGKSITVEKDATIIDALHHNNIKVEYSCLQGTCGTCVTPVLEGEVDHRDAILHEEEKMRHDKMCLCVSRAKQDRIVIDL
jgi:vanillate O-demethylase ferredoxin subunit